MAATEALVTRGQTIRGQSGRQYVLITAQGECGECGAAFGVTSVVDPADETPRIWWVHDGGDDPAKAHRMLMSGDSDAAKALRSGTVIAKYQTVSDEPVN